jgi:hypothetical protein
MSYFTEESDMDDWELEAIIRRQHSRRRYQRSQVELLQQELELEDELLTQNPEMAGFIYQLNSAESARQQQGFSEEMQPDLKSQRRSRFMSRLFPGIE